MQETGRLHWSPEKQFLAINKQARVKQHVDKKRGRGINELLKRMLLHLFNLNPLHQRLLCAIFRCILPRGSGEVVNVFSLYRCYDVTSPYEKKPHKFTPLMIPSLIKIGQVVLKRKMKNLKNHKN